MKTLMTTLGVCLSPHKQGNYGGGWQVERAESLKWEPRSMAVVKTVAFTTLPSSLWSDMLPDRHCPQPTHADNSQRSTSFRCVNPRNVCANGQRQERTQGVNLLLKQSLYLFTFLCVMFVGASLVFDLTIGILFHWGTTHLIIDILNNSS